MQQNLDAGCSENITFYSIIEKALKG